MPYPADDDERRFNTYLGVYDGVVIDNADPQLVGRVRVMIPGLIEPYSGWALPVGAPGSGSDAYGLWCIPKIGSNVAVLFKEGDIDRPRYLAGPWGAPNDSPASPTFVRDLSPSEAVQMVGLQTKAWEIILDDRAASERLVLRNRAFPDNTITIDGLAQAVEISGTVAVQIKSTGIVNIDALQVTINGRIVLPTGGPI